MNRYEETREPIGETVKRTKGRKREGINIDEAIKTNQGTMVELNARGRHKQVAAIQLGIEALELQTQLRELAYLYSTLKFKNIPDIIAKIKKLLPSETEEE